MQLHPCCGNTQLGTKCLAVADLVFGLIGIFWFVYMLERYELLMDEPSYMVILSNSTYTPLIEKSSSPIQVNSTTQVTQTVSVVTFNVTRTTVNTNASSPIFSVTPEGIELNGKSANILLSGFYTTINLVVFVLLLSASHNIGNKYKKNLIKLEIWFYIRLFILVFKIVLYSVYIVFGVQIFPQIPHIIFMVVHAYGLWVVTVFIHEVETQERIKKLKQRSLGFITVFEPMPKIEPYQKKLDRLAG